VEAKLFYRGPCLEPLPQEATESTLCHEMIHAWVDLVQQRRESHGPLFRAQMAAINAAQSRFQVSVRHNYPIPVRPPRWMAVCPAASDGPLAAAVLVMRPADRVAISITGGVGIPVVCCTMSLWSEGAEWTFFGSLLSAVALQLR
jgi:hypothetical protein